MLFNKRAIYSAFIGLLILTMTACFGIGGGGDGEEQSEQSGTSSNDASESSKTESPGAEASSDAAPSPTRVATTGELFLQLVEPDELEVITDTASMTVTGRTRVDALVTINDTIAEPNIDGEFSLDLTLEEGPNIIELVSSVASGEQKDLVLVAIYVP